MQPDPLRLSRAMSAQKLKQRRLLASESPHSRHRREERQADGHR